MAKIKQVTYVPQEQKKGIAEKITDFVGATPLLRRAGGMLFKGSEGYNQLGQTIASQKETEQRVLQQIEKNRMIGKDTTRLEQSLNELRKSIVQTEQAYQGLPTGGVTNKEVLGSAIQTASWVPAGMALKGAGAVAKTAFGASKAGRAVSTATAGLNTVKGAAIEGAASGFMGGVGMNLQDDPNANLGSALASGAGGAVLGAGLGAGIQKVSPFVASKLGQEFSKMGSTKEMRLAADAVMDLTKALPPSGKKTVSSFLKDYTGAESSGRFNAMQAIYERNKGKMIKTLDGVEKEFDPRNIDLIEDLPSAFHNAKESLYEDMTERLYQGSKQGLEVDTAPIVSKIRRDYYNSVDPKVKAMYKSYLDVVDGLKDPLAIRTYLSEIGAKTGPFMTSGSTQIEGKIAADVYKGLEDSLNNFFAKNNAPIRELFDQFSNLKRIEYDITKAVSAELRKLGNTTNGQLLDDYGISLIGSGLAFGSPMQVGKGGLIVALRKFAEMSKDPVRNLKKAFQKVDDWYNKKGINSVIPEMPQTGIVPVGEVNPLSRMEMPRPMPKVADEAGVAKPLIQQVEEGTPSNLLPGSSGQPLGFKGEGIPVAPTGSAIDITAQKGVGNFDINSLTPEQRGQLEQEVIKAIEKITGQKKNLNNEGGFINPVVATVLGALGLGTVSAVNAMKDKEVSSAETPETKQEVKTDTKTDLRKGFTYVENRGAVASGEDVYKVKGVTGDLGKYQVKPQTLKEWSAPWLGKTYSPEEFLKDPEAQEKFMDEFLAVVDSYKLTPEEAAIIWHKGWGVLGDQKPRAEKEKALKKHIESKRDEASEYVKTFKEGLNQ